MSSIYVLLSLVAVAFAFPQRNHDGALKSFRDVPAGPGMDVHVHAPTNVGMAAFAATTTNGNMMAPGRTLWNNEAKMAVSPPHAWDAEARMAGRSVWDSHNAAVHYNRDAQPAVEILQQEFENPAPGNYMYSYKTANGIEARQQASLKADDAEVVQGEYSWVAPNGEKFAVEYVADEMGYHARGAHIPEIPAAIARSLAWNAAHPEEEAAEEGRASWMRSGVTGSHMPGYGYGPSSPHFLDNGRTGWGSDNTGFGSTKFTKMMETRSFGPHSALAAAHPYPQPHNHPYAHPGWVQHH